jgi:hypothetical protein
MKKKMTMDENKINQVEKEKGEMSKPMGMMTMYQVRMGIQKAIRKFETDKSLGDGLELTVGCYLALLKSYNLELKYRDQIGCKDEMEFFASPWNKLQPEVDDKIVRPKSGGGPMQSGLAISKPSGSTEGGDV